MARDFVAEPSPSAEPLRVSSASAASVSRAGAERPIIFSAPMVRALLAGRKTQTRRIAKIGPMQSGQRCPIYPPEELIELEPGEFSRGICHYASTDALSGPYTLPFAVGDRLWVKEPVRRSPDVWLYEADGEMVAWPGREELAGRKRNASPAMYLPRSCSRLTLLVTEARVERLQDISEEDARAEGAKRHVPCKSAVAGTVVASDTWHYDEDMDGRLYEDRTAQGAFEILWGKINGWKSWDANPWVAVSTFKVVRANIDAAAQAIEVRRTETQSGSARESAVGEAEAPTPSPDPASGEAAV